jgi:hypothetical protein
VTVIAILEPRIYPKMAVDPGLSAAIFVEGGAIDENHHSSIPTPVAMPRHTSR